MGKVTLPPLPLQAAELRGDDVREWTVRGGVGEPELQKCARGVHVEVEAEEAGSGPTYVRPVLSLVVLAAAPAALRREGNVMYSSDSASSQLCPFSMPSSSSLASPAISEMHATNPAWACVMWERSPE